MDVARFVVLRCDGAEVSDGIVGGYVVAGIMTCWGSFCWGRG